MAEEFWTIHVWTAAAGREDALVAAWEDMGRGRLGDGGAASMALYRVSGDARVHYTPMRWASRDAYEAWRAGEGRAGMHAVEAACERAEVVPLDAVRVLHR